MVSVALWVVYVVGAPGIWCRSMGLRDGEQSRGEGGGLFRWINTVDTKGFGSRDLLFSSTLPSISLNPSLPPTPPPSPHFPPPSIHGSVLHFAEGKKGYWSGRQQNPFSQTCGGQFRGEKGIMALLKIQQGEGSPKRSTMH